METNNQTQKPTPNSGLRVHQVLATSYIVYLISIFVGFIIELSWDVKFTSTAFMPIGFVCIILGTLLSYWAQNVSGKTSAHRNCDNVDHTNFLIGPYKFTRSPTQYGLLLMALGLAFLYSSIIMICTTIIAFILGKFVFIPMEEKHLANKYGQSYSDYKKKVRI
jgi:protein-S-isoprenylcysteine O-methyltransferase Ste14